MKRIQFALIIATLICIFSVIFLRIDILQRSEREGIGTVEGNSISLEYRNSDDIEPLIRFAKNNNLNVIRAIHTSDSEDKNTSVTYYGYYSFVPPQLHVSEQCKKYLNTSGISTQSDMCSIHDIFNNDIVSVKPLEDLKNHDYKGIYLFSSKDGTITFQKDLNKADYGITHKSAFSIVHKGASKFIFFLSIISVFIIFLQIIQYAYMLSMSGKKQAIYLLFGTRNEKAMTFFWKYILFLIFGSFAIFGASFVLLPLEYRMETFLQIICMNLILFVLYFLIYICIHRNITQNTVKLLKKHIVSRFFYLFLKGIVTLSLILVSLNLIGIIGSVGEAKKTYSAMQSIKETKEYGILRVNSEFSGPVIPEDITKEVMKKKSLFEEYGGFYLDNSNIAGMYEEYATPCESADCPKPYIIVDKAYIKKYAPQFSKHIKSSEDEPVITILGLEKDKKAIRDLKDMYTTLDTTSQQKPKIHLEFIRKSYKAFTFVSKEKFFHTSPILVIMNDRAIEDTYLGSEGLYIRKYDDKGNSLFPQYSNNFNTKEILSKDGFFVDIDTQSDTYNHILQLTRENNQMLLLELGLLSLLTLVLLWEYIKIDLHIHQKERILQFISGYSFIQRNSSMMRYLIILCILLNISVLGYLNFKIDFLRLFVTEFKFWHLLVPNGILFIFLIVSYLFIWQFEKKNRITLLKGGEL